MFFEFKNITIKLFLLILMGAVFTSLNAEELETVDLLPTKAGLISQAIISEGNIIPIVVTDKWLDSYRIFKLEEETINQEAIKYFFDSLNLADFQIEKVLRSDFDFLTNTAILLAGENGNFYDASHHSLPEHYPPMLSDSGKKWLLFVKKIDSASDLGADDLINITQNFTTLQNSGMLVRDLYTILDQQVGFEINDQNKNFTVSSSLISDIEYIFGPLRKILSEGTEISEEVKIEIRANVISTIGKEVVEALIQKWKPNLITAPLPTTFPKPITCEAKTSTKIDGAQSTFKASCPTGCDFQYIQATTDLVNWSTVTSVGPDGLGPIGADGDYTHIFDVKAASRKFFRAKCLDISAQETERLRKAESYLKNLMQEHKLLAKWNFDDPANRGIDSLGTTILSFYGNPQFILGYQDGSSALVPSLNKCAFLDGEAYQNYPVVQDNQSIALTAWIKTNYTGPQGSVFVYTTPQIRIWLMIANGKVNAIIGSTIESQQLTLNSSKIVNDLRWHQIGFELDFEKSQARLIIDGEIDQEATKSRDTNCGLIADGKLDFKNCSVPLFDPSSIQPFGIGANNKTCNGAYLGYKSIAVIDDPAMFLMKQGN